MPTDSTTNEVQDDLTQGFWTEVWKQFRKNKLAMVALLFVIFLGAVAVFAPAIAGTKPIICQYKGKMYYPALGYLNKSWENPVFQKDRFRKRYAKNLQEKDPESWAIWPLVYQDPYRRVRDDEWPGRPGNPTGADGRPSRLNLMGTTQNGVDVFAQMVHGTRIAMLVGVISMGLAATIGIIVGAIAGYFGGWIDICFSRLIEVVMSIPALVLILAMLAILERATIWHIMAILGCTRWTGIARLTRAEFLKLKQLEYVTAAKAIGAGNLQIMFRHILRNALAPVLVPIMFGIASAILVEASLSFLGFGAPPPNPSWGTILNKGRETIEQTWWLIAFPGSAIFLTVLAYNLIGEGIQQAIDPRLKSSS